MNLTEFNKQCFPYLVARYRNFGDWFEKMPTVPATGFASRADTLQAWFDVLRYVDLEDAKAAIDALYCGTEAEPKSRDKYPQAIVAIARKLRGRRQGPSGAVRRHYVDGEEIVGCVECLDDGRMARPVQTNHEDAFPNYPYQAAFACRCWRGDQFRRQKMVTIPQPSEAAP